MRWFTFLFLLCAIALSPACAEEKPMLKERIRELEHQKNSQKLSAEELLELGRLYFFMSLDDENAIEKGYSIFNSNELTEAPFELKARMYKAVLKALEAKYSVWPWRKFSYVNDALEKMDSIVQEAPESFELRLLRASVTSHLPFFFSRGKQAEEDLERLKEQYPEVKDSLDKNVARLAQNFFKDVKIPQAEASSNS